MIEIIAGLICLALAVSVYSFFIFYKLKKVSDKNKEFTDSLNNLSMREQYLKEENEKLLKDIEKLNDKLKNDQILIKRYKLVEQERDLLKNELNLIKKDINEFNRLFVEIRTKMKDILNEREKIHKELKNLQIKLNNAVKDKKNAETELDRFRNDVQEELIRIYAKVDSIMNKVEYELKSLAAENRSLKRHIEELSKEKQKNEVIDKKTDEKDRIDLPNSGFIAGQGSLTDDIQDVSEFYDSIDQSLITELSRLLKQKNG